MKALTFQLRPSLDDSERQRSTARKDEPSTPLLFRDKNGNGAVWLVPKLDGHQRVAFKIAGLVHQSLDAGAAPAYLADNCHLLSDAGRRPLRSHSNDIRKLLVPRTHNKLDDRSFSAAGPRLWNDLPPRLRQPGLYFDSFRRSLKRHLFGD